MANPEADAAAARENQEKRKAEIAEYVQRNKNADGNAVNSQAANEEDPDEIGRRKSTSIQYDSKTLKVQYLERENQESAKKIKYLEEMLAFMVEAQSEAINASEQNSSMQGRQNQRQARINQSSQR